MQFADFQLIMWRTGKLAMADIRDLSGESKLKHSLTSEVVRAFEVLLLRVTSGKPRTLKVTPPSMPTLVFTDGAFEPVEGGGVSATVGGVFIPPSGRCECLDAELILCWTGGYKYLFIPLVSLSYMLSVLH